ncbi:MAG: hypothetical protein AAFU80_19165 [Pseudomonadota bacterium]
MADIDTQAWAIALVIVLLGALIGSFLSILMRRALEHRDMRRLLGGRMANAIPGRARTLMPFGKGRPGRDTRRRGAIHVSGRMWAVIVVSVMALLVLGLPTFTPPGYVLGNATFFREAKDHVVVGPINHYRDGDTFEVNGMAVRLARLDCPEMETGEGARAKWAVMELTRGVDLTCRFTGRRSYDRWIGTCRLPDGRTVTRAMVDGGYCSIFGRPNFRSPSKERLLGH